MRLLSYPTSDKIVGDAQPGFFEGVHGADGAEVVRGEDRGREDLHFEEFHGAPVAALLGVPALDGEDFVFEAEVVHRAEIALMADPGAGAGAALDEADAAMTEADKVFDGEVGAGDIVVGDAVAGVVRRYRG